MHRLYYKLSNWRIENDYTQEKIASILNVSSRMVQYWESGDRYPSIYNLILIADMMDVSLDYLCGRTMIWQTSERIIKDNLI